MPMAPRPTWLRIVLTAAASLAALAAVVVIAWALMASDARARTAVLEAELSTLVGRNEVLARSNERARSRVEALRTDPRMLEKVAREEHNLVTTGSWVYLFPRDR